MLRQIQCPNGHSTFNLDYLDDDKTKIYLQCRQCNQVGEIKADVGYGREIPLKLTITWRSERK